MNPVARKLENFYKNKYDYYNLELSRESFFPTQVWYATVPDREVRNRKLLNSVLSLKDESDGIVRSNQLSSWHSDTDIHTLPQFSKFASFMEVCIGGIFYDCGYKGQPKINTMWGNVNPRNSFNRCHLHPDSLISGIYYIRVPKDSGSLRLFSPNIHSRMSEGRKENAPMWMQTEVVYDPCPRKIIMFPSEILHEVEPNLNDQYEVDDPKGWRISIAFNCSQVP